MYKVVQFIADLGEFKAGEILEVEAQIACDAIAQGFAVPSVEAPKAKEKAPEVKAFEVAPEVV